MSRLADRKYLLLLLSLLLLAVLVWRAGDEEPLLTSAEPHDPNSPDAYVIEGRYTMFRPDGQVSSILISPKAVHYPLDNTGQMQEPHVQLFQRDGRPWHIQAQQGFLDLNLDSVRLEKDVLVRSIDRNNKPVSMETQWLKLDNLTRFITTDQAVKITSQTSETNAVGMDAYVDDKRVVLKSQVRGNYEALQP